MTKGGLLQVNKRGVSEIVSYVLLIVIAVGASVLVYTLLSQIVPRPSIACSSDISLVIKDAQCSISKNQLNITFLNKGRFSVDAAYIRVGIPGRDSKTWINNDVSNNFYFGAIGKGLPPNREITWPLDISTSPANTIIKTTGEYILEVQPAMWDTEVRKIVACESIVTETINCED